MTTPLPRLVGLSDRAVLDTSETKQSYLVTTEGGNYIRLSPTALQLLIWLEAGGTPTEIAERMSKSCRRPVSEDQVKDAIERLTQRVTSLAAVRPPSAASGFVVRFRVVSADIVRRIAPRLATTFRPYVAGGLLLLGALAGLRAYSYHIQPIEVRANLWTAFAFTLVSLFIHEFGHASACARFGAKPDEIGAGIYFMYPAFYSNVTDAWRLTRWQRVIVDVAGLYFQTVACALLVGIYELTHWAPLRPTLYLIWGTIVFALNPFLKFDGYWIISDVLGVANLSAQRDVFRRFAVDRICGREAQKMPWPKPTAFAVAICSSASLYLWIRYVAYIGPMLWHGVVSYSHIVMPFAVTVIQNPAATGMHAVVSFLAQTYLFACAMWMAWRFIGGMLTTSHRWLRRRVAQTAGTGRVSGATPAEATEPTELHNHA